MAKKQQVHNQDISISSLKTLLERMKAGDVATFLNVEKDAVNLLKASLDCYCNVGERVEMVTKELIDLKQMMLQLSHQQQFLMDELKRRNNPLGIGQGAGLAQTQPYTTSTMPQWANANSTTTAMSPYEEVEKKAMKKYLNLGDQ